MSATDEIAALDAALAEDGEDIVLRRTVSSVNTDVTCRAFVRAVSPEQLMAGVKQDNSNVIISPTEIIASNWPDTTSDLVDVRVPTTNDWLIIAGRTRKIGFVAPIYLGGELVRMDIRVTG
jgi:hypothetical protein